MELIAITLPIERDNLPKDASMSFDVGQALGIDLSQSERGDDIVLRTDTFKATYNFLAYDGLLMQARLCFKKLDRLTFGEAD